MITLGTLKLYNFFAVKEAVITFRDKGFVVVVGPNGSGKTTMTIEGVLYALYGTSFEYGQRPGSAVKNRWASDWNVEIDFTDGDSTYKISRGKKGLFLFKDEKDISRSRSDDTQEIIEQILGRSESLFRRSVIFSVNMKRFSDLPESEKKALFDELTGIGSIDVGLLKTEEALKRAETELSTLKDSHRKVSLRIDVALDSAPDPDSALDPIRRKELAESIELNERVLNSSRKNSKDAIKKVRSKLEKLSLIKDDINSEMADVKAKKASANSQLYTIQSQEEDQRTLIKKGICPECRQKTDHLVSKDYSKDKIALKGIKVDLDAQLEILESDLQEARRRESSLNSSIRALEDEQDNFERTKERSLRESRSLLEKIDENLKREATQQGILETLKEEQKSLQKRIDAKQVEVDNELVLKTSFGKKGFRVGIQASMIPELNREILSVVEESNSPLSLQLSIKGEDQTFSGSFGITVINPSGSDEYRGSSAGEKKILDLILMLAMMSQADQRARVPFNHVFFDETLENLDEERACVILGFMRRLATRKSSVLLTAHRTEKINPDHLWTIYKGTLTES